MRPHIEKHLEKMNRHLLLTLVSVSIMLSSCMNREVGIFGRLPELYEQAASRQRDLELLLRAGKATDIQAQQAMHSYMQYTAEMARHIEQEAKLLTGSDINVTATSASGIHPTSAKITNVRSGIVTIVEISIELAAPSADTSSAYLCFMDEDGEPIAKSEAWYDTSGQRLRIDVPFALNPDGATAPEGTFMLYDKAMRLRIVSPHEYMADNFEGDSSGALLSLPTSLANDTSVQSSDSVLTTETLDSLSNIQPLNDVEIWTGPVLTPKGIGDVHLGASLSSLPSAVNGLYDHKKLDKQYDEMEEEPMLTATFYQDGKIVMTALGDEQGNLIFLTVESPLIKVDIDGHYIGVGDSLQDLLKLKGVAEDESGAFAATYHGVSFAPTPSGKVHAISIGAVW